MENELLSQDAATKKSVELNVYVISKVQGTTGGMASVTYAPTFLPSGVSITWGALGPKVIFAKDQNTPKKETLVLTLPDGWKFVDKSHKFMPNGGGGDDSNAFKSRGLGKNDTEFRCTFDFQAKGGWQQKFSIIEVSTGIVYAVDPEIQNDNDFAVA